MGLECEDCGQVLKNFNSLQKHKLTHVRERPYSCETCGKGFRNLSNLKKHKESHDGKFNSIILKVFYCQPYIFFVIF